VLLAQGSKICPLVCKEKRTTTTTSENIPFKGKCFINNTLSYTFLFSLFELTHAISNNWRITKQQPIAIQIKRRKWRWIGHTLRKPTGSIEKVALDWNPQGA
jgi:hypothetical protein